MKIRLNERKRENGIATLAAAIPPQSGFAVVRYKTWTGALLRVDGATAGAFDREHHEVLLPPCERERAIEIDAELHALPTNGLPSGPGVIWWFLNKRANQNPSRSLEMVPGTAGAVPALEGASARDGLMLLGHSHLDVAWLWTYAETRRKAQRTFAIACDLLDRDGEFIFIQSQPQLYEFVEEADPALFERVAAHVRSGRFDTGVAAMWVESDCNIPAGETLLRQIVFAYEYCEKRFGARPLIAWLPDTFGFANTLPQLLVHAGLPYFATTKLQWNDTTKFPYPQFVWEGPDGSRVVAALIQSYDGGPYPWRVRRAKERNEPLVLGYGDGGGGVTSKMLQQARSLGRWIRPGEWFDALAARREKLPVHDDELYLEYHRGVYTTHHDVKFHHALLERALAEAEELLAWCLAVHAPRESIAPLREKVRAAWEVLLRASFHDVLPGTSIAPVYRDALAEYGRAEELAATAISAAQTVLPRSRRAVEREALEPVLRDGLYIFENEFLRAAVTASGTIVELAVPGRTNLCAQANVLALYDDKPKAWDAWNVDADYSRRMRAARPHAPRVEAGALVVDFDAGRSAASMTLRLFADEPFLRVDLDVEWREKHRLLRVENWLALQTDAVTYGSPHGTVVRTARARTPQERAKFEVPGQRFAAARDAEGDGVVMFALDTYGWNARALAKGGLRLGHSLLRAATWPDPNADGGEHRLSYAFAPFYRAPVAALERAWQTFAHEPRVRLFTTDAENAIVAACKPAENGDGVIVRVRECDGRGARVRLNSSARMTEAVSVDALERPVERDVAIDAEALIFDLKPFELRSFRVRYSHG